MENRDWLLVTTTRDGQTRTSRHENERDANVAGHIARYGCTPEEREQRWKDYNANLSGKDFVDITSFKPALKSGQWRDFNGKEEIIREPHEVCGYYVIFDPRPIPGAD